jgi:hypothetical protein
MAIVWSTYGSHDMVPSKIISCPSFNAATSNDDAASVENCCTYIAPDSPSTKSYVLVSAFHS